PNTSDSAVARYRAPGWFEFLGRGWIAAQARSGRFSGGGACRFAQTGAGGSNTFEPAPTSISRKGEHVFRAHRSEPRQQAPVHPRHAVHPRTPGGGPGGRPGPQLPKDRGAYVRTAQCEGRVGERRTKVPRERETRFTAVTAPQPVVPAPLSA